MGTRARGSLSGLIFDKSLKLAGGADGSVLNLMQNDADTVESMCWQLHTSWDGPLQIMVYSCLLYNFLGSSVFWGISVLLLSIPLNGLTLRYSDRLSQMENAARDSRTKLTSEAISNMELLKLQNWENEFASSVARERDAELRLHVRRGKVRALNMAVSNAVPSVTLLVTLTAYARTGRPMLASTIFTAISLFNQLRFPLFFYPIFVDTLARGRSAMRRMSDFLTLEEIADY